MLMRFDPFQETDRLLRRSVRPSMMAMDAYRDGDNFVVQFDIPGVDPNSIDLTVEKNVLTVSAERSWEPRDGQEVIVAERPQGSFNRQLFLGDSLDTERMTASYRDGVLTLTIPTAEQAKPRKVAITATGDGAGTASDGGTANDTDVGRVTVPRRTIAIVDRYDDAQELVDRLSDRGFPVEHVTIVGRDLRLVERVVGRLDWVRAALGGLLTGAVWGVLFGLVFGVWFAHDGTSLLAIVAYWIVIAALFGLVFSLVMYALSGGRRNFTSVTGMQAARYEVLIDEPHAEEAIRVLAGTERTARRA
jgi:HSP20 family protein